MKQHAGFELGTRNPYRGVFHKGVPKIMRVNAPARKHNTPRGVALPGVRTIAPTAEFTGMCISLLCQMKKREAVRAGFELATLRL